MKLDHVTIRTRDLQATRSFFLKVFDLKEGERPLAIQRIPGHWLYSNGHPLVHIIGSQGYGIDRAAEAIDHVGFRTRPSEQLNPRRSPGHVTQVENASSD